MAQRAWIDNPFIPHYKTSRFKGALSNMNSKTALQLKKELITKQDILLNLQTQNTKMNSEEDATLTDMMDRSEIEESWFAKERMSQHWKTELKQITLALQKIETGSFGICEECDDEIPVKRLRVRPDASLCLNCQETMEKEMGSIRVAGPSSVQLLQ